MISVSRFKKVFLILTAFVCVIAGVSMKAKADYAPMTVIKTPSLNTAMKQGDIIPRLKPWDFPHGIFKIRK